LAYFNSKDSLVLASIPLHRWLSFPCALETLSK
jgi:hypothetical protein